MYRGLLPPVWLRAATTAVTRTPSAEIASRSVRSLTARACNDKPATIATAGSSIPRIATNQPVPVSRTGRGRESNDDEAAGPEQAVILSEQAKLLTEAVAGLPEEQREVVILKEYQVEPIKGRLLHADLSAGANVAGAVPLDANSVLANRGASLFGAGFIVTPEEASKLGLGRVPGLEEHVRVILGKVRELLA